MGEKMIEIIYITLIVVNICGYICRSRTNKGVEYFSEIFIALFIASTRYVPGSYIVEDQTRYQNTYYNIEALGSYAQGYKAINYIGNLLNLSFDAFYVVVTIICTIVIFRAIRKMECNGYIISIVFLLYYILIAADLLKNFIAFSIFLTVFPYLLSTKKKDRLKYVIGVILASLFHISFLLFLVLLIKNVDLSQLKTSKNWKRIAAVIVGIVVLIFITNGQKAVSFVSNTLLSVFLRDEDTLNRYSVYTSRTTHLSAIIPIFLFLLTLVGLTLWKNRTRTENGVLVSLKNRAAVLNVFLVSSVLLPLVFTSAEFFRIIRDITIVGILYLSETSERTYIRNRLVNLMFVLLVLAGWFIFDIVIKGKWENFMLYYFNIQELRW